MSDDEITAMIAEAEHIAETHRLHNLGLLTISRKRGVILREPGHPRVQAWQRTEETVGELSARAWLLFEIGQMAREARPPDEIARILEFGARTLPSLSDREVTMQLDALGETRGTLH
jgi:hypothetical protein